MCYTSLYLWLFSHFLPYCLFYCIFPLVFFIILSRVLQFLLVFLEDLLLVLWNHLVLLFSILLISNFISIPSSICFLYVYSTVLYLLWDEFALHLYSFMCSDKQTLWHLHWAFFWLNPVSFVMKYSYYSFWMVYNFNFW